MTNEARRRRPSVIHIKAVRLARSFQASIRNGADSKPILLAIAVCFGAATFLVSELMHYLLVPELGRHGERMVAEGVSGLIVGCLAALVFRAIVERRNATLTRLQVISEMNHHVRNALVAISLSADEIQNQQSVGFVLEAVDRIEWSLREILPREKPLPEEGSAYVDGVYPKILSSGWTPGDREKLLT